MQRRYKGVIVIATSMAILLMLNPLIDGYNNGHQQNDNLEWDCGGSCHTDPTAATITIGASKTTVNPGEVIDVTVTITGAEASATPLGVMIVRSLTTTNSQPSVDGWVIVNDPSGSGSFNYYEEPSVTGGVIWTWQMQTPMVGGAYTLYAHEHHGNGGRFHGDSNGVTVTVVAPDNPPSYYVTAPGSAPGEQYTQGTILSVDWAASDDNPWPSGGNVVNLTYGPTPTGGTTITNLQNVGAGTYSWDTSGVAPGLYYISGSVYDSASQITFDSSNNSFEIIVPDNAPSIYITGPGSTPGEQYVQGTTIPISWAASDDNPWPAGGLVVNLTYGGTPTGGTPIANDLDVTGGYMWDTSLTPPGTYYINGSVWDSSGQNAFNNCNNSFEIVAPDNPPLFFITNPGSTPGEVYTQGTVISVQWAASDDNPWPAGGMVVNLSFGATPAGGTPLTNDQDVSTSYSWDTSSVAPGVYYVNGSVYDSSGQMRFHSSNSSFEIIIPDDPPTLFITNPGSNPGEQYVQGSTIPISWTAADDNPWPATGLVVNMTYGPTAAGGIPIANNQDVSTVFSWDTTGIALGAYYVNASVWDSRGQTVFANSNNSFDIIFPDTPPSLYVTNPGSTPGEIYGQGSLIAITWSAWDESPWPSAGNVVNISYGATTAGGTPIANDQDVTLGYSWDTTGVPVGFYYINASVYDSSGNMTFANTNNSFEITAPDTTPPVIMNAQSTPDPQELGLPTNISASITDDTTIDFSSVFVNVTYPSLTTTNISMKRSLSLFWVDQPFLEVGLYAFTIWVSDTSFNWASAGGAFEIVDTTAPIVVGTTAIPSPQMSGGSVNISTSITDIDSVATADLEVFDPVGTALFNVTMLFDSVNARYYWNTTYTTFGFYTFDVWTSDPSGNWGTDTGNFEILGDVTPPQIMNVNVNPPVQVSGGIVNVSASVIDDFTVSEVWLETFDPSMIPIQNVSMSYDTTTGTFYHEGAYVAIGTWSFTISANDTSDNWASAQGVFEITDGTPPDIFNVVAQPSPQEMNGAVNISAFVIDNIAVSEVWVEIVRPDLTTLGNFSMSYNVISGAYFYERTYAMLGTHTFTIWAQDSNVNFNSKAGSFDIVDSTPPTIIHTPVVSANLGASIPITADVTDAGTIGTVTLFYMNVGDTIYLSAAMTLIGGNEYSASVPTQTQTGEVRYYIESSDASNNFAQHPSSGYHTIVIDDKNPPAITNPKADPTDIETGESTTISAEVSDDSGITEVHVFVTGPDGSGGSSEAVLNSASMRYEVTFAPQVPGMYTYTIWALDGSGNWGSQTGSFNATTPTGKTPNPPSNLETREVDGEHILVSWIPPNQYHDGSSLDLQDIEGYHVYRSESANGAYIQVTSQLVTGYLYLDRDVSIGTTYFYKVSTTTTDGLTSVMSDFVEGQVNEEVEPTEKVDILPWLLVAVFLALWVLTLVAFMMGRKKREGPGEEPPVAEAPPSMSEESSVESEAGQVEEEYQEAEVEEGELVGEYEG